jgi:hypothetical protein
MRNHSHFTSVVLSASLGVFTLISCSTHHVSTAASATDSLVAASIGMSPGEIIAGQSAELSWSSTNATKISITPDIGTVGPSGKMTVSPSRTTTYTINVSNSSGSYGSHGTASATVTVKAPVGGAQASANLPAVGATVSPGTIQRGQSATLSWSSTNATSIGIAPSIGEPFPFSGSRAVSPAETTTYTFTVRNDAGVSGTAAVTLTVENPTQGSSGETLLVTGSIIASPDTIHSGESTQLKWNSFNATDVTITPGVGHVNPSGAVTVSPTETTTYTLNLSNSTGDKISVTATVYVKTP